ncbi:MAG: dihydroxyacetone kinase subunit DhaK [Dorea sp.]
MQSNTSVDDLRCYCRAEKKPGKVAIITGGGSGHLPLFLGYGGRRIDRWLRAVGGVFQSPSPEQIYNIAVSSFSLPVPAFLYLYGNYTGDIMTFDMATDLCDIWTILMNAEASLVQMMINSSQRPCHPTRRCRNLLSMFKAAGASALTKEALPE